MASRKPATPTPAVAVKPQDAAQSQASDQNVEQPSGDAIWGYVRNNADKFRDALGLTASDDEAAEAPARPISPSDVPTMLVKRLDDELPLPERASEGAGAVDLRATEGGRVMPGKSVTFGTGIAVKVPSGYVLLIFPRSGHGINKRVRLNNCVGVIDSDYVGEIKVALTNDHESQPNSPATNAQYAFTVERGDRIAQAMLVRSEDYTVDIVDELPQTERGENGLGSTGSK